MIDTPFSYQDYEEARSRLISIVNGGLTEEDKQFLVSFEEGNPDWSKCCSGNLEDYPSVKWKLQNIGNLIKRNPKKHKDSVDKLRHHFGL